VEVLGLSFSFLLLGLPLFVTFIGFTVFPSSR
jgi:hypothetical protein